MIILYKKNKSTKFYNQKNMSHDKEANKFHEKEEDKLNNSLGEENKEMDIEDLANFENEIRVYPRSSISTLLNICERLLSYKKSKELQLSASGKSISKLITLVEIVKSMHPYLIQDTVLTTIKQEGANVESDEIGKLSPNISIILSMSEPQGKIHEKMSEGKKEEFLDIWEEQKERENKNKIQKMPMANNNNRIISLNNQRIGFVKKWRFGYGNSGYRWQMNGFGNMRNRNWRNYNGNWSYVNNKNIWRNN